METISNNAVNVLSTLGSDTSIRAIRYQSIEKKRILFSGYIYPGIFNVGQMLLTTHDILIAKGLSSKDDYTKLSLPYLNADKNNKYTGIISGTIAPIETIYPQIILSKEPNINDIIDLNNLKNDKNKYIIRIIKIKEISYTDYLDGSNKYSYLGIFAIISNIIGIGLCFNFQDYYIFSLLIFNIISNYILGIYFYFTNIKYSEKSIINESPKGDAIIEIGNEIIILKGKEKYIQSLLQVPMIIEDKEYLGIISGILCIITGILNVIIIPLGNIYGQLIIALLLLIGYMTNVFFAAFDKDNIFKKLTTSCVSVNYYKKVILPNRTSALSFVFCIYKKHIINCKHLVPNSMTWKEWFNSFINDDNIKDNIINKYVDNKLLDKLMEYKDIGIESVKEYIRQEEVTQYNYH